MFGADLQHLDATYALKSDGKILLRIAHVIISFFFASWERLHVVGLMLYVANIRASYDQMFFLMLSQKNMRLKVSTFAQLYSESS